MYILPTHQFVNKNCIEILGMPASGKSTLLRKMMNEKSDIVNVNHTLPKSYIKKQFYKLGIIFICFIYSPFIFISDIRVIVSSGQKSMIDLFTVLSNWFLIVYLYNQKVKNANNMYIWDQGLFQALWSISFSANKNFDMIRLLGKKRLPTVVHITDAIDEILLERAHTRNTLIRLNYKSQEHIERGRRALKLVLQCMEEIGYNKV